MLPNNASLCLLVNIMKLIRYYLNNISCGFIIKTHIRQLVEPCGSKVQLNTGNKNKKSCPAHMFFCCWVICMSFIWCEYLEKAIEDNEGQNNQGDIHTH